MRVEVVTVTSLSTANWAPIVTRTEEAEATFVCMLVAINLIANQVISTLMQKHTTLR